MVETYPQQFRALWNHMICSSLFCPCILLCFASLAFAAAATTTAAARSATATAAAATLFAFLLVATGFRWKADKFIDAADKDRRNKTRILAAALFQFERKDGRQLCARLAIFVARCHYDRKDTRARFQQRQTQKLAGTVERDRLVARTAFDRIDRRQQDLNSVGLARSRRYNRSAFAFANCSGIQIEANIAKCNAKFVFDGQIIGCHKAFDCLILIENGRCRDAAAQNNRVGRDFRTLAV